MGLFDWLTGNQSATAQRDAAPVRATLIGVDAQGMIPGVSTLTGLGLSAVFRCLDVLSNGVAQLPWREMRGNLELPPSRLVRRPQAARTRREWVSLVVSTLALFDVCYLLKAGGEDFEGVPLGLWPVNPNYITPIVYSNDPFQIDFPPAYWVGLSRVDRDQLVVLHRSPQPTISETMGGVIRLARAKFAEAIAVERYASRYWQNGGNPVTALETDLNLNEQQANEIADRWAERRARGPDYPPVLSGGMKAHPYGADPSTEAAIEVRRELVADIGRYFGVSTRLNNAPAADSVTYHTSQEANMDLLHYTLQNYIGAIEDAITDLLPGGRQMSMRTSALTEGTQLAQAQAMQLATGNKAWLTVDEARDMWDLGPVEAPDQLNPMPSGPIPGVQGVGQPGGMMDGNQAEG